jgi:hypothetical protein
MAVFVERSYGVGDGVKGGVVSAITAIDEFNFVAGGSSDILSEEEWIRRAGMLAPLPRW